MNSFCARVACPLFVLLLFWLSGLGTDKALAAAQGTVVAWGYNFDGQGTVPANLDDVVGVAAGEVHSLTLKDDGTVVAWGFNDNGESTVPNNLSGATGIAAGWNHSLAMKQDGSLIAWGFNGNGLSTVPTNLSGVAAIASGSYFNLALKSNGTVAAWGYNDFGQIAIPTNLSGVVAVAAGLRHGLALKEDRTVVAWGWNDSGQSTVPTNLNGVIAIAAGWRHSLALKGDGTLVSWGSDAEGQVTVPTNLSEVVAIAAGAAHSLALKGDGTLIGWGANEQGQSTIPTNLNGIVAIAAGGHHNLAVINHASSPFLLSQLANQTVNVGATTTLYVAARGGDPLAYQWQKDDAIIADQTNATLILQNVQFTNNGGYRVIVSNAFGVATSQVASLTVQPPYTLAVLSNGYGSVDVNPLKARYLQGEGVLITAIPARWRTFTQWNDGVVSNPRLITVESNALCTAFFAPTQALETFEFDGLSRLAPVGMPALFVDDASNSHTNSIAGNPGFTWQGDFILGSNVNARGSATVTLFTSFPNGTMLYTLDGSDPGFSARLYGSPFVMKKTAALRAIAYNADFTQSVQSDPLEIVILPTLTASTEGGGSVAVDPAAGAYFSNDMAVVTATPAPGWTFLQWLGDATGTNPVANISMVQNKCVQAVFGTSLSNTVVGSGSVVRSPAMPFYPYGTTVRLAAVPQAGSYFALWGNAASGTNNPLHFTITNANPTVTAVFAALPPNQYALAVLADGPGSVTRVSDANRFTAGSIVTLTATPAAGQSFLHWSGDAIGIQNPLILAMNSSKVITATFTKRPRMEIFTCGGALDPSNVPLQLRGEPGLVYNFGVSTNLVMWSALATVTNLFGTVQWNDTNGGPHRFYKAAEPPPLQ